MKHLFLITLSLLLGFNSKAQIFGGESVTVYDIKFKAKEVTGQSKFNSNWDLYRTKILAPLYETNNNEYLNRLGTYRNSVETTEANDLFNLSLQDNTYPFLDKIDFDFYKSKGFDKVITAVPGIENDEAFKSLRFRIDTAKSTTDKKNILFESKHLVIRNQLVLSRYDVITKAFYVDKKKVSKTTAEFKAQLDTIVINNNLEGSANIRAYLSRLADEAVIINGFYYDARLDPTYISTIKFYVKNTAQIDIGNDKFAYFLRDYIKSTTAAANTGLVAIQLGGTYDKSKVSIDSISADLQTKFNIPAAKAAKVAASVSFAFSKSETTTFKNKFNSIFVLRYFTSGIFDGLAFSDDKFTGIYKPELTSLIVRNQTFNDDTNLSYDKIILQDGAQIKVASGKKIILKTNELVIEGAASIDGTGENGKDAVLGRANDKGDWSTKNHSDYLNAGGHDNDKGYDATPATNGQDGASIKIVYKKVTGDINKVKYNVKGGSGGNGASGGQGRKLIDESTGESKYGSKGKDAGKASDGIDGSFVFEVK